MSKIPYFNSIKEAQAYLDYLYSLPIWKLATHYRTDNVVKVSDWRWQNK